VLNLTIYLTDQLTRGGGGTDFVTDTLRIVLSCTLIKKKTTFSSYLTKLRWDRDGKSFLINEEIFEEAVSHI
jgi:hypothetical protein